MKNLSLWAKNNRRLALTLVIFLHIILSTLYFYVGVFLFAEDIILSKIWSYVAAGIFIIGYFFYPKKNATAGIFKPTYFRIKFFQFFAMISVALFMVFAGNQVSRVAMASQNPSTEFSVQEIALDIRKESRLEKKENRKELKKLRRKFRKQLRKRIRSMRKAKRELSVGAKIFLLFLVVLAAVGLGFLVLALACSIACAGSEALAILVAIGGFALIILGVVHFWRKVIDKEEVSKPDEKVLD